MVNLFRFSNRCYDRQRVEVVAVISLYGFIIFFDTTFFSSVLDYLLTPEKNKKRYSTDDTVAPDARPIRTRTSLRSLDTSILSLGASSVVPFLCFSLLSSRSLDGLCFFFLYLSRRRNFFILMIPEPRARAMMPRAARPSSNTKYSRRRPRRRDALFRRLALTSKAFFKTEDKRARQREVEEENIKEKEGAQKLFSVPGIFSSRGRAL